MKLSIGESVFYLAEECLAKCGYLQGLQETLGTEVDCSLTSTEQEIELLCEVLSGVRKATFAELPLLDALCVDPSVYSSTLEETYAEFVYLVGEHTGVIPRIDHVDLEDVEFQELKELFPDYYSLIAEVITNAHFFATFEVPLPSEHITAEERFDLRYESRIYRFTGVKILNDLEEEDHW